MTRNSQNWGDVDESYIHSLVWEWLEAQPAYTHIASEVSLGGAGNIDLVAKTDTGTYVGFEVKVNPTYTGYKDDRMTTQFPKYKQSGYLDELYLVGVDNLGYDYLETFLSDPGRYDGIGVLEVDFDPGDDPPLPGLSETEITEHRKAEPLPREQTPTLSQQNEAWVQHHVWKAFGDVKEGKLPDPETTTERQIDVLWFEGGDHPTEVLDRGGEIIGVEAKNGDLSPARGAKIREQLDRYVQSGALSQIYLAVPAGAQESAEEILCGDGSKHSDAQLSTDIANIAGLLIVDQSGDVEVVREATSVELEHDGYRVDSGSDYLRTVGYGKQFIRHPRAYGSIFAMNPVDRSTAYLPPLDSITQEAYDEPVTWPPDLVSKIEAGDELSKAESVWKHVLERRDEAYGDYQQGTEWAELTAHEKASLALQPKSLVEDLPIDVSQSYLKDILEEMSQRGYVRGTAGKGSWAPGVDGRVKFFLIPLRVQLGRSSHT